MQKRESAGSLVMGHSSEILLLNGARDYRIKAHRDGRFSDSHSSRTQRAGFPFLGGGLGQDSPVCQVARPEPEPDHLRTAEDHGRPSRENRATRNHAEPEFIQFQPPPFIRQSKSEREGHRVQEEGQIGRQERPKALQTRASIRPRKRDGSLQSDASAEARPSGNWSQPTRTNILSFPRS